jgi:uncharacterized protein YjbI with pentapeptide repeats
MKRIEKMTNRRHICDRKFFPIDLNNVDFSGADLRGAEIDVGSSSECTFDDAIYSDDTRSFPHTLISDKVKERMIYKL